MKFNVNRKKLFKTVVVSWILCLAGTPLLAQQITVRGTVTGEGAPMPGVSVVVKGTYTAGVTGADGGYSINVPDENAVLQFSFLGYISQEVTVGPQRNIDVTMQEDAQQIDQVVVIGYGTVSKKDLTGSVASVTPEQLTAFTVVDPILALQGVVPGVQISQNTGDPAGDYKIRIRGVNSIQGDNNPLYIIDGIPSSTASISTYDIASLEVLKDASATAIYGSRGANGVVLITTKRGKSGRPQVSYDFEYGLQTQIKRLELMDGETWARFYNEYLVNSGRLEAAPFTEAQVKAFGKGTDWQRDMFRTAPMASHNLTVSGGAENIKFFVSGSLLARDGLLANSSYDKYTLRSSLDFTVSPMIDASLQMGYSSNTHMNQAFQAGSAGGSSMINAIYSAPPIFTPYDENGVYQDFRSYNNWSWISHELRNPTNIANETRDKTVSNLSNVNASITFKPLKGLSLRSVLGLQNSDARQDKFITSKYIYSSNSANVSEVRSLSVINENILNYNTKFGDAHRLDLMAGFTYQQDESRSIAAAGSNFFSDVLETNSIGSAAIISTPSTSYSKWVLMSWLGRVNYSLLDKYLLTVSFRADGSSRYSPGQRWGYFPSGAFAWRIIDENFMEGAKNVLSDLKLRVGWGQTGSTAIAAYATQNLLINGKTATGNGNYTFYAPPAAFPGKLKWETTAQWNFGLDIGFLKDRIVVAADYYSKKTTDLLNRISLPSSSGYTSSIQNIGSMSNRGVEVLIDAEVVRTQDFGFTTSFNIAHNRNRIDELKSGVDGKDFQGSPTLYSSTATVLMQGQPMGSFFTYLDNGLDENGRLSYVDRNDDGRYDDTNDRDLTGSPFPDFTYGLNCGFRWKNLDFNFFLQGSHGNKIYNNTEMRNYQYSQGLNVESHVYANSWRPGNENAHYPKIEDVGALRVSNRFVEDGSYLRLKNIQLAYNLPTSKWATKNWLGGIRVYVSAQNYLTFTKYRGVDPEVSSYGGDISGSIDHLSYPNSKTITFGLSLKFN